MVGLTESDVRKLNVNELKAELSTRSLIVKGKKDELVKRLLEALESEGGRDVITMEDEGGQQESETLEAIGMLCHYYYCT